MELWQLYALWHGTLPTGVVLQLTLTTRMTIRKGSQLKRISKRAAKASYRARPYTTLHAATIGGHVTRLDLVLSALAANNQR